MHPRLPVAARFVAREDLRILDLGDEAVVFDPLSWDAHLLNPAAVAVLDLLQRAPRSERDVEEFLRDGLRPDVRAEAAEHARRLLAELQSLGLARALEEDSGAVR